MSSNATYKIEYAKTGRSSCKASTCKKSIDKEALRIGKVYLSDRFTDDGQTTDWFHIKCFFEAQSRARKTTKKVESTDDLEGLDELGPNDQKLVENYIKEFKESLLKKSTKKKKTTTTTTTPKKDNKAKAGNKGGGSQWTVDPDEEEEEVEEEEEEVEKSAHKPTTTHNSHKRQQQHHQQSKMMTSIDKHNLDNDDDIQESIFKYVKKNPQSSSSGTTTTTSTTSSGSPTQQNKSILKSILSKHWYNDLEPTIINNSFVKFIGNNRDSSCLPRDSREIFTALNSVEPKNCSVVFLGNGPLAKGEWASGYSFCDNSASNWRLQNFRPGTKNLIKAALFERGYISKEDDSEAIQEVLKEVDLPSKTAKEWFRTTAKQGVLWLNTIMTCTEDQDDAEGRLPHEQYWKPVFDEIIRVIFQCRVMDSDNDLGIVFVILGKQLSHLKNRIEIIHSEFMGAVTIEFVEGVSPLLETFHNVNYLTKINTALERMNRKKIDWWKPISDDMEEDEAEEFNHNNCIDIQNVPTSSPPMVPSRSLNGSSTPTKKTINGEVSQLLSSPPISPTTTPVKNNSSLSSPTNNNSILIKPSILTPLSQKSTTTTTTTTSTPKPVKSTPSNSENFIEPSSYNDEDLFESKPKITTPSKPSNNNTAALPLHLVQEDGTKVVLKEGELVSLGRNNLAIRDKVVSRNQAQVKLTKESNGNYFIELTPLGQNPMHIIKNGGHQPLTVNEPVQLKAGDIFLLCSQKYPFKVEARAGAKSSSSFINSPVSPSSTYNSSTNTGTKRKTTNSIDDDEKLAKKLQDEENKSLSQSSSGTTTTTKAPPKAKTSTPKPPAKKKKKTEEDDYYEPADMDDYDDEDDDYIPPGGDKDDDDYTPWASGKTRSHDKPPCKYWDQCYRKNPDHLKQFRHP
eukprot:gene10068-12343_t